jgi:acyl-CoA thioester hydrolase
LAAILPFVHRLRVRSHECDHQGIVFNGTWLAYIDVTMSELVRVLFGSYTEMIESGLDVVVVEARLRFRAPARFEEELEVSFEIDRLGTTSMAATATVRRDGDTLLEADMAYVFIDPTTIAKQAIPEEVRTRLAPWIGGAGGP